MRRVADPGRLEQPWRRAGSGLFLEFLLTLVARSQRAEIVTEQCSRSTSTTTDGRSTIDMPERSELTRATRPDGSAPRRSTHFRQSDSQQSDARPPVGEQPDEPGCVSEVCEHADNVGKPSCIRPDYTILTEGQAVPIELKRPATLGLWAIGLQGYHLTPAAQQPPVAHSLMQQALPTGAAQAEGNVDHQAPKLAAVWQLLTQMLYLHTAHGVLTDAIVYVFVHTRWVGRRLYVDYYLRHRADTMPTVIQCFAHICRSAAAAGPLDVPPDLLRHLPERNEVGSGQGAQGDGAPGFECVCWGP
jgi:hypothetical protein